MYLFVDNLTHVDFSYLHPSRGLSGQTWQASVMLEGQLDEQGMICDFGTVKKKLRQRLDQSIDHSLLVPSRSNHLNIVEDSETIKLVWTLPSDKVIVCQSPKEAVTFIDAETITAEHVEKWCIQHLQSLLPGDIDRLNLTFTEENINAPCYQYSHGLKKHGGNCQRIAHGHRSRLAIWKDGKPAPELVRDWASKWQDIYLGSQEDLVETPDYIQLLPEASLTSDYYHFAYQARQGHFSLSLPRQSCELLPTDTTVEFIAQHIAMTLKQQFPQSVIRVQAFEGIGKGAIAEA